jgi:hypothetical protein
MFLFNCYIKKPNHGKKVYCSQGGNNWHKCDYSYSEEFIPMAYWTLLKNNNSCKGTCDQELRNVTNDWCASMDEN